MRTGTGATSETLSSGGIAAQQAAQAPQLPALAAELTEAGRAFLNTAVPFHRLRAQNALIVHGGISGDMRRFPAGVREAEPFAGRDRDRFRKVLRTRFIDRATGGFVGLGQEKPGDPFWAEVYDGRFGHVVFGHQPCLDGPAGFAHATGTDHGRRASRRPHGAGVAADRPAILCAGPHAGFCAPALTFRAGREYPLRNAAAPVRRWASRISGRGSP